MERYARPDRLAPADVASLHRETRATPQHVGQLALFRPPAGGFDYDRLVRLLEERISLAPRFRQRVRTVPGHLAGPVWVDDPNFDIGYHVRRSALPRPGTDRELLEFCARIESRLLDRARPLWEMYLVEGLSEGRLAILTKTHEAMIGDHDGIDLAQVILDAAPEPRRTVETIWMPEPAPGALRLVCEATYDIARRPVVLADTARDAARDLGGTVGHAVAVAGGLASAARALVERPDSSPLRIRQSEQRRLAVARTTLADYRTVRDVFGGSVNDVMLAVVTGALRGWLLARDEAVHTSTIVRALVPVSVADVGDVDHDEPADASDAAASILAGTVRPLPVDLPVGEADPVLRLAQLRYAMASHRTSGRAVGAAALAGLAGFGPPTLHALGARAAGGLAGRMFHLVVTNVPGPQHPLYASGARMIETFPIVPLGAGQAMSIGVSSYDGGVFYGINGDRDAVPDLADVGELVTEALSDLVALAEVARPRRGRRMAANRRAPRGSGR